MIKKEKVLEILYKYAKDNFGINSTYIDNLEFDELAEELVKNCYIPDVGGQSEQLKPLGADMQQALNELTESKVDNEPTKKRF